MYTIFVWNGCEMLYNDKPCCFRGSSMKVTYPWLRIIVKFQNKTFDLHFHYVISNNLPMPWTIDG